MSSHLKTELKAELKAEFKPMQMLLVEDSTLLRDVLIETIAHIKDVTVAGAAATQQHAISLLDSTAFDIVLLDIELAQGNGFEVIKHIQKKNYLNKTPILMMLTNHAHTYYRSLADDLGVDYFFDKSMDFDLAIAAIELEAEKFSRKKIN
jgi:DNA-binding NarL/FixJ family response regulator